MPLVRDMPVLLGYGYRQCDVASWAVVIDHGQSYVGYDVHILSFS